MSLLSSRFFQPLESRMLLSGTVHLTAKGALNITLDNTNNDVTVGYSDAAGSAIVVNVSGTVTTIPQTGTGAQVVTLMHIHCGKGSDDITITPGPGSSIKAFDKYTIIRAGAGHDDIVTGNETDVIFGGAGYDTIATGNGNDSVLGGSGHDSIVVGNGNDYIVGGGTHAKHGGDTIVTGNGNDTVFGLAGDDDITLGSGTDDVYASNGDTVNAGGGADTVFVDADSTVDVNGSVTIKHVTKRNAHATWVAHYRAAIANAKALAAGALNY